MLPRSLSAAGAESLSLLIVSLPLSSSFKESSRQLAVIQQKHSYDTQLRCSQDGRLGVNFACPAIVSPQSRAYVKRCCDSIS
jgi:hypothetical protein